MAYPMDHDTRQRIMIVTFKTKTWANIVMFGDVAVVLLRMMGHSGTVPGALRAEEVGPARERLRTELDALSPDTPSPGKNTDDDEPVVTIHQRAYPLLELLAAAEKAGREVMWE
jgi:hypothetical protein